MNISLSELLIFLLIILLYYLFDNIRFKINNLKDSIENKKNKVINNISDDPERYHDVFSILYKLNDKLINMIGIDELAKRLNITSSAIRCINKKKIRTLNTAKKYIRNFNKILKEEAENNTKYNKGDIVEIEEAENKELLRLIDYLLSQMSQIDLSIRSGIAQSTLSYIYNRKILMKRNSIRDYIYRLKKVETAILGIALTNNKL